jgi:hypothetical protein
MSTTTPTPNEQQRDSFDVHVAGFPHLDIRHNSLEAAVSLTKAKLRPLQIAASEMPEIGERAFDLFPFYVTTMIKTPHDGVVRSSVGKSKIVWSNDPTYRTAQMVKDAEIAWEKEAVEREATEAKSAAFEAEQRAHHATTTPSPADAKRFVAQMVKNTEIAWKKKAVEREDHATTTPSPADAKRFIRMFGDQGGPVGVVSAEDAERIQCSHFATVGVFYGMEAFPRCTNVPP